MSGFLLDTNVVSELRKRERCAPKVDAWARSIPPLSDYLSVLAVGELRRGAALKRRSDPATADALDKWISGLSRFYSERTLPVTLEVAETWGALSAMRTLPLEDGLMAATALVHGLTFVTRNVKNVESLGVSLLNPWM